MEFPPHALPRLQLLTELPLPRPPGPALGRAGEQRGCFSGFFLEPSEAPAWYKNSVKATVMFPSPSKGRQRKVNQVLHIHGRYNG